MTSKVSILIYSHNNQNNIWKSISSAAQQSYQNIEIIVIDDGSKDKSTKILKMLEDRYPIVKVYYQAHLGCNKSRENLLTKASGEYVLFLNAKDELSSAAISIMVRKGKGADLVVGSFQEKGELIHHNIGFNKDLNLSAERAHKHLLRNKQLNDSLWGKLLKKRLLDTRLIGLNNSYQELIMLSNLIKNSKQIVAIKELIYYYKEGTYTDELNVDKLNSLEDYVWTQEFLHGVIMTEYPKLQGYSKFNLRKCYSKILYHAILHRSLNINMVRYARQSLIKSFQPFYRMNTQ